MSTYYLTTQDVADRFSVTIRTVANWVTAGFLHPIRVGPRGNLRYSEDEVSAREVVMGAIATSVDPTASIEDRRNALAFLADVDKQDPKSAAN